jgi:hypothetical protein
MPMALFPFGGRYLAGYGRLARHQIEKSVYSAL